MSPGSEKWRISDWRGLLRSGIVLIDTLAEKPRWSFGGGTSLAVFYDHRCVVLQSSAVCGGKVEILDSVVFLDVFRHQLAKLFPPKSHV